MEELKNLYIIKQRLADLKPISFDDVGGYAHEFRYYVGGFTVTVFTGKKNKNDRITLHNEVFVNLSELSPAKVSYNIDVMNDSRFSSYEPINYEDNGYYGVKMPILKLCELVKYLHRLEKIAVFT